MKTNANTTKGNNSIEKQSSANKRTESKQFNRRTDNHISTLDRIANSPSISVTQKIKNPEEEEVLQGKFETTQKQTVQETKPNKTGLPDNLKTGVENLSGLSMDDVKVSYNSPKPAQLQAHAYAQGTQIHLGPGQEKHLPHEAWHVVQQKQGRVKPTLQMKGGVNVNDDTGLEKEADVMGGKALQFARVNYARTNTEKILVNNYSSSKKAPIQRLTMNGTQWNNANKVRLTEGSGKGVAIIEDGGDKLVVKAGEEYGAEVIAATNLMREVMESKNAKVPNSNWKAQGVAARALKANEIVPVSNAVTNHATDSDAKTKFLLDVQNHTSVVYAYAPGEDMEVFIKTGKVSKPNKVGRGRSAREDSPAAQTWMDSGQVTLLGRASAVDVLTGNGDRLLSSFNPKNYRVDLAAKTLILIDNINYGGQSALKDTHFDTPFGPHLQTAEAAFNEWKNLQYVDRIVKGKYDEIAEDVIDKIINDLFQSARDEDKPLIKREFLKNKHMMEAWFINGLDEGMKAVMTAMKYPEKLLSGVPANHKDQVKLNIVMRAEALRTKILDSDTAMHLAKVHLGIQ